MPDPHARQIPAEVNIAVTPPATTEVLGVPRGKVALALVSLFAVLGVTLGLLWDAHLNTGRVERTIEDLGRCLIVNQQVSLEATVEQADGGIVGDPADDLCMRFLPQGRETAPPTGDPAPRG